LLIPIQNIQDTLGMQFYNIIASISTHWITFKDWGSSSKSLYADFRRAKPGTTNMQVEKILWYVPLPKSTYSVWEVDKLLTELFTGEFHWLTRKKHKKKMAMTTDAEEKMIQKTALWILWTVFAIDCKPLLDMVSGKDISQEDEAKVDEMMNLWVTADLLNYIWMESVIEYPQVKELIKYGIEKEYNKKYWYGGFKGKRIIDIEDDVISHLLS